MRFLETGTFALVLLATMPLGVHRQSIHPERPVTPPMSMFAVNAAGLGLVVRLKDA